MCKPYCSSIYGSLLIYLPQRQKLLITMIFSYIPSWFAWFVYRCSRSDVFCKKGILRNFGKLTGKHLRQRLFLIKWQVYDPQFIKKETLAQVFSSEFSEISKKTFFHRTPLVAASVISHDQAILTYQPLQNIIFTFYEHDSPTFRRWNCWNQISLMSYRKYFNDKFH